MLGLLGGFLLAELIARLILPTGVAELRLPASRFEPAADVPGIPYLLRANAPGWTDNLGLRNSRDVTVHKAPGVFRLLVVGDSVTALSTDGTSPDRLFSRVLETLLRQRLGRPLEVLNLSCPGLSLEQDLVLLRARGLRLEPDLVLLAYAQNDPVRTPIGKAANIDVWSQSRILQVLQLWLAQRTPLGTFEDWYRPGSDVFEQLDHTFAELADLAARQPLVLVPLPVHSTDSAQQIHLGAVAELCRRHRLRCLDIYDPMLPYLSTPTRGPMRDLLHFDSVGHRAVAEALAGPLSEIIAQMGDGRTATP